MERPTHRAVPRHCAGDNGGQEEEAICTPADCRHTQPHVWRPVWGFHAIRVHALGLAHVGTQRPVPAHRGRGRPSAAAVPARPRPDAARLWSPGTRHASTPPPPAAAHGTRPARLRRPCPDGLRRASRAASASGSGVRTVATPAAGPRLPAARVRRAAPAGRAEHGVRAVCRFSVGGDAYAGGSWSVGSPMRCRPLFVRCRPLKMAVVSVDLDLFGMATRQFGRVFSASILHEIA